ncbi:hypothetical protein C8T65DRAFT_728542 [Cerioporus squamosus]|nr:hypothetical protein C8T65DRAFT_728542 [Cerioporus squamosus]
MPRCYEPSFAFPDEILRVGIPAPPPQLPERIERPAWPTKPIYFTEDGRGIAMSDLLIWASDPEYLRRKMGRAYHQISDALSPGFWINVTWPGYPQYSPRTFISNAKPGPILNATVKNTSRVCGEIAVEIAKAYQYYMTRASEWEWYGTVDQRPWRISRRSKSVSLQEARGPWGSLTELSTLHLVSLQCIGGDNFKAEVHEVFRPVELPDGFWDCFELVK